MNNNEKLEEYISVGEMAQYTGKTPQQIYNLLHSGEIMGVEFKRGTMRGWLIAKPKDYDQQMTQG